jgi:hypothetical protein
MRITVLLEYLYGVVHYRYCMSLSAPGSDGYNCVNRTLLDISLAVKTAARAVKRPKKTGRRFAVLCPGDARVKAGKTELLCRSF